MSSINILSGKRLFIGLLLVIIALGLVVVTHQSITTSGEITSDVNPVSDVNLIKEALAQIPESVAKRHIKIQNWQSSLGIPVYFISTSEIAALDIELNFNAGSARDDNKAGLANLTVELLDSGTVNKSSFDIARSLEQLGTQFSAFTNKDRTVISMRSLSDKEYLQPSIELLTEIISQPTFQPVDFNRVRNQQVLNLQYQAEDAHYLTTNKAIQLLYPDHPYSSPIGGSEHSLKQLSEQDVRQFHKQYYVARNLSIALTGNITREQAEQISEQISLSLPLGAAAGHLAQLKPGIAAVNVHIPLETEQVHILLASQGIDRTSPDYPAMYVANHILGGRGLSSILMDQLREKQGLVYGVYSLLVTHRYGGSFSISTQTRAGQTAKTINEVQRLFKAFVKEGPTEKQLHDAIKMINGSYPMHSTSNADLTVLLGDIGFFQLPVDELDRFIASVNALTREQIKDAMSRVIDLDKLIMITVGPEPDASKL